MTSTTTASFNLFQETNPEVTTWLLAKQLKSNFAASLLQQARAKGKLSPAQLEAVRNCIRRDADFDRRMKMQEDEPGLDLSKLEAVFEVAREKGVANPILRLGDFKFKYSTSPNNYGAVWVTSLERRDVWDKPEYLGKLKDGRFQSVNACSAEEARLIKEVASNPAASAKAFGQRTGMCCVCGRKLTKGESIDRMIGPICADKYGF